jgi:hypothetical protein
MLSEFILSFVVSLTNVKRFFSVLVVSLTNVKGIYMVFLVPLTNVKRIYFGKCASTDKYYVNLFQNASFTKKC